MRRGRKRIAHPNDKSVLNEQPKRANKKLNAASDTDKQDDKRKDNDPQELEIFAPIEADLKLLKVLSSMFQVKFPIEILRFWKHVQTLTGTYEDPCAVFNELCSLQLVGIFEYMAGQLSGIEETELLTYRRYPTDLPEMQTIALYNEGRFAYFRDYPEQVEPMIVHVTNGDHFPSLKIVGAIDPFYILSYFIKKASSSEAKKFLPNYWTDSFNKNMNDVKGIITKRREESIGNPLHGIGIHVDIRNGVGYRPLTVEPKVCKKLLEEIPRTENESERQKRMGELRDMITYVQFANDEMDYGMGLELGHNLFYSNYDLYDTMATITLSTAYRLLERRAFVNILGAQMKNRRR